MTSTDTAICPQCFGYGTITVRRWFAELRLQCPNPIHNTLKGHPVPEITPDLQRAADNFKTAIALRQCETAIADAKAVLGR